MQIITKINENWFNQKSKIVDYWCTLLTVLVVVFMSFWYLNHHSQLSTQWPISYNSFFSNHKYYTAWTSLLIHADIEHLLSNIVLFIPFSFFLTTYFGKFIFPLLSLFIGGVINILTVFFYHEDLQLIGISGLVYWMGAVSFILFYLIDGKKSKKYKFAVILFLTLILFVPDKYNPQISYLCHLIGYLLGLLCGYIIFKLREKEFKTKEVREVIVEMEEEYLQPPEASPENESKLPE